MSYMANSYIKAPTRFGARVNISLPYTANGNGMVVVRLVAASSGQAYAYFKNNYRLSAADGASQTLSFPVSVGDKVEIDSQYNAILTAFFIPLL